MVEDAAREERQAERDICCKLTLGGYLEIGEPVTSSSEV